MRVDRRVCLRAVSVLLAVGCNRTVELQPPNLAALTEIERAGELRLAGDWEGALDAWRRAAEANPRSSEAPLGAAALLAQLALPVDAVVMYEMAAHRSSSDPRPYLQLAELYASTGRPEIAKSSLEAAERVAPKHPEVLIASGRRRLEAGDLWGAAGALGAAARLRPDDPVPRHLSGLLEWKRQAFGEAGVQLRRAVDLDLTYWQGAVDLARLMSERGRPREALGLLTRTRSEIKSPPSELVLEMARLERTLRRDDRASALEAEAAALAVREAAVSSLRDRLWAQPTDADLRRELGESLRAAGDLAAAEGAMRGWARLAPEEKDAWWAVVEICHARGDEVGAAFARERYQDAGGVDPPDGVVLQGGERPPSASPTTDEPAKDESDPR